MEEAITKTIPRPPKTAIWDCDSSLYDSFELKAFEKQLDSAIASRSMSMPHLSSSRHAPPPPPMSKKPSSSKISRSLNRLIRSLFRPKNSGSTKSLEQERFKSHQGTFYDHSVLSAIPEAPEFDALSPEIRSLVRRTASDRFSTAAVSIGISCA